jgi:hypothetical protein
MTLFSVSSAFFALAGSGDTDPSGTTDKRDGLGQSTPPPATGGKIRAKARKLADA